MSSKPPNPNPSTDTNTPAPPTPHYPPPISISPSLTLQPPLTRRGHGPGLILILDYYAHIEKSERHLDPPPLQKWAEEGFCVVQILVPGKTEDGGEFPLQRAIDVLGSCGECVDIGEKGGVGVVSYLTRIPFYIASATLLHPKVRAIVSHTPTPFTTLTPSSTLPPQLLHAAGPPPQDRQPCTEPPISTSPCPSRPQTPTKTPSPTTTHRYPDAPPDSPWTLPADPAYHKLSAGIAHARSLAFLKRALGGPYFDLEAVWEEHCRFEFAERDVGRTMGTMVAEPYVNHVPTMTGGIGHAPLTSFYTHHFIFSNPPSTTLTLISRSVGPDRVIDEFIFSLTHTTEVPWLLPSIPPTGRRLEIPFTSVVAMRGDRLCHEHISWDQGTVLMQLGLLPEWVAFPYRIAGEDAPEGKRFEVRVPVVGGEGARKLGDEGAGESNGLMGRGWRVVDDV
ncbi:NTF2-like protein [Dothidotthia symphoricarpi CBS 119687]|uniref:NTF2-like protein n=1 Tax=Dothidotthia symphoricarpi CBS 119687 TaxID=1392245 RepID=A0A6A6AKT0_9PLEO|nr:NTF2-like protein [Dothidotthia symphoricarpi CBS 119687]KAF2132559.1 NTF2-like protein [Dothidotthia symphoricarpi CBS 119687]